MPSGAGRPSPANRLPVCGTQRGQGGPSGGGTGEDWRWSSLWRWHHGGEEAKALLSPWPVPQSPGSDRWHRPRTWLQIVNTPISGPELEALRVSAQRGRPFGESIWVGTMVQRHGLAATTRNPGRPRREDP
jgi:putative transposase